MLSIDDQLHTHLGGRYPVVATGHRNPAVAERNSRPSAGLWCIFPKLSGMWSYHHIIISSYHHIVSIWYQVDIYDLHMSGDTGHLKTVWYWDDDISWSRGVPGRLPNVFSRHQQGRYEIYILHVYVTHAKMYSEEKIIYTKIFTKECRCVLSPGYLRAATLPDWQGSWAILPQTCPGSGHELFGSCWARDTLHERARAVQHQMILGKIQSLP